MGCKSRAGQRARSAGLVVLLVLFGGRLSAQLQSSLSEQRVSLGSNVTFTILVDHEQARDVAAGVPDFPAMRLIDGPNIRPITRLANDGGSRAVEIQYTFTASASGRYVLPSVSISVAGQPYQTEEHLLEIVATRGGTVPFLARWSGPIGPLVVGQSAVFTLEAYNATEFIYPASLSISNPAGAIMEEVQGLGEIEQLTVDGTTLYTIPLAVLVLTPTEPGTLLLPSTTMRHNELQVTAPSSAVEVRPLPDAVLPTGAVGEFVYSVSRSADTVAVGRDFTVTQAVSGQGNLTFLSFPDLEIEGFREVDSVTSSDFTASPEGYRGRISRSVTLRAESEGPYTVVSDPFFTYDPGRDRVSRISATVVTPSIATSLQPPDSGDPERPLRLLSPDQVVDAHRTSAYNSLPSYGWFFPGILFLFLSRVWKQPKATAVLICCGSLLLIDAVAGGLPIQEIERGWVRYNEGNLVMAIHEFEGADRAVGGSPGILHNLSLLYFRVGDIPRALFAAREATRFAPRHPAVQGLAQRIEASAGIDRSIAPRHVLHPDLFFFVLVGAVNVLAILVAVTLKRAGRKLLVPQLLLAIVILGATVGLVISANYQSRQLGVVRSEYDLQRIPEPGADGWLVVPAGTAVDVLATQGRYYLVQTTLGLQGWLPAEQLLWPDNPMIGLIRYRGFLPPGE